jgi:hypothetical protein
VFSHVTGREGLVVAQATPPPPPPPKQDPLRAQIASRLITQKDSSPTHPPPAMQALRSLANMLAPAFPLFPGLTATPVRRK